MSGQGTETAAHTSAEVLNQSTLLSTMLTQGVEELVEAEAEAVAEKVDHLLGSLHLQGRAKLLY